MHPAISIIKKVRDRKTKTKKRRRTVQPIQEIRVVTTKGPTADADSGEAVTGEFSIIITCVFLDLQGESARQRHVCTGMAQKGIEN